jgi:transketolase
MRHAWWETHIEISVIFKEAYRILKYESGARSILGMRDFRASPPVADLLKEFDLTPGDVVRMAKRTIE